MISIRGTHEITVRDGVVKMLKIRVECHFRIADPVERVGEPVPIGARLSKDVLCSSGVDEVTNGGRQW